MAHGEYCPVCERTQGGSVITSLEEFRHLREAQEWVEASRATAPVGAVERREMMLALREMKVHHAEVRVGGVTDLELRRASILHVRLPRNPQEAERVSRSIQALGPDEVDEEMPGVYRLYWS